MKPNKQKLRLREITLLAAAAFLLFTTLVTPVYASDVSEQKVLELLNQARQNNGLKPLKVNDDLERAARLKTKDMLNRDYFDHSAFGLTPWDFINNAGYEYDEAGENLAMDFRTSEGMVNAWMNSPKHRDNILNPDFNEIGIGVIKGEFTDANSTHSTFMVTNMFGHKKNLLIKAVEKASEITRNLILFNR